MCSSSSSISIRPAFASTMQPSRDKILFSATICRIFNFLPTSGLAASACVNHSWKDWTNNEQLWQESFSPNVRDDFTPLVTERILSGWKEVYVYAPLSPFLANFIDSRKVWNFVDNKNWGELRNPKFFDEDDNSLTLRMPTPFVRYGNYSCVIFNLIDVEVSEKGKSNPIVLKGEKGVMLTHLAVEGRFLFALTRNRKIIQWDYKTGTKIQEIETSYSIEAAHSNAKPMRACYVKFYIRNGWIILHDSDRNPVEIIHYGNLEKRQQISADPSFDFSTNFIIENDHIIGVVCFKNLTPKNFSFSSAIWVKSLSTGEVTLHSRSDTLQEMITIDQSTIYTCIVRGHPQLRGFNLRTKTIGLVA